MNKMKIGKWSIYWILYGFAQSYNITLKEMRKKYLQ